ncbi:MAG: nickel-responsive transcriptional regulator NikR [PVC group bacterium]
MGELIRFGVSLDHKLLERFDAAIRKRGYTNRSEALRDLIRADLVVKEWEEGEEVVGVIMIVFNHHLRELQNTVTDIQHRHLSAIISTQHVHLDHDNCLEIVVLKGRAGRLRSLADRLKAQRGIKHCSLSMSTTGSGIS